MKPFGRQIVYLFAVLIVSYLWMNTASAVVPSGVCVSVATVGQLRQYCNDGDFNGIIQLTEDIKIDSEGVRIKNNDTGSRQLTIDLSGHNIITFVEHYDFHIWVEANTTIMDSTKKGSIILQRANEYKNDGSCVAEILIWPTEKSKPVLRLENISVVCVDGSIEVSIRIQPSTSLEMVHCSLSNVQVNNSCGVCIIEDSRIELKRDSGCAVNSEAHPADLAATSASNYYYVHWEDAWLNDALKIKNSQVAAMGQHAIGVRFQGDSMMVENSMISAVGDGSVGISYGEYRYGDYGDREVVQPVLLHSYISGSLQAIQYSKRDGDPVLIENANGFRVYLDNKDSRIALAGAYLDDTGNIQQTKIDTKVLYPLEDKRMIPGFFDVRPDDWYAPAVMSAVERGLMTGVEDSVFSPDVAMTRGMLATVLWRMEGDPVSEAGGNFADLTEAWYANAVGWAAKHGIIHGYGDRRFGPEDVVTREQLATILARYAAYKEYRVGQSADLSAYTDADSISDWARDAMAWANGSGLMTGNTATTLNPQGTATRAETATILVRLTQQ